VLPKPIQAEELQRHVERALSGDGSQHETIDEVALARLRRAYGSELSRKVAMISSFLSLAKTTHSERSLLEARRSAHSLSGTAGSYGFTAVGKAAGRVSELLENGEPRWEAIEESLAELRERVECAAASA